MKIAHIFVHDVPNAGDMFLKEAVKWSFRNKFSDVTFVDVDLMNVSFTEKHISVLNECDLVVIGGGGLFHKSGNQTSGWFWDCSLNLMDKIKAPIVVYAVGYDKFRGQVGFDTNLFNKHVEKLLDKSIFFSVRSEGSRTALSKHLPKHLCEKLRVDFCPSISMANTLVKDKEKINTGKIGLIIPGDFLKNRHRDSVEFTKNISALCKEITKSKELYLIIHDFCDFWLVSHFISDGIPFKYISLALKQFEETIDVYSQMDAVIGERGHSVMIPFGVGCEVVGIISHDKVKWFLDDVNMPERAIEESDPNIVEKALSLLNLTDKRSYKDKHNLAMVEIQRLHNENLEEISKVVLSNQDSRCGSSDSLGIDSGDVAKEKPEFDETQTSAPWEFNQTFPSIIERVEGHTYLSFSNCHYLIQLAENAKNLKGEVAEIGTCWGGSTKLIAIVMSNKHIYSFDTFSGLPIIDGNKDGSFQEGMYVASYDEVKEYLGDCPNISLHKGVFPQGSDIIEDKEFCFVHCDVDIYQPTIDTCEFFYSRMVRGGMMVFDDPGHPVCSWKVGQGLAVKQWFENKKESPIMLHGGQALVIKI